MPQYLEHGFDPPPINVKKLHFCCKRAYLIVPWNGEKQWQTQLWKLFANNMFSGLGRDNVITLFFSLSRLNEMANNGFDVTYMCCYQSHNNQLRPDYDRCWEMWRLRIKVKVRIEELKAYVLLSHVMFQSHSINIQQTVISVKN